MAKRHKKGKRRFPSHLRKYWFKKKGRKRSHRKAPKMARRRHRKSHRKHHRTHRRRRGGGGARGWMPGTDDLKLFAAGAAIGKLEAVAKADANFPLNKVPRPVTALGYTGGTAIALWALSKVVGGAIGNYARLGARAAATAAAYQMGKQGAAFTSTSISGWDHDEMSGGPESYIDDHVMGALDAEGTMMGNPLAYDNTVEQMDT